MTGRGGESGVAGIYGLTSGSVSDSNTSIRAYAHTYVLRLSAKATREIPYRMCDRAQVLKVCRYLQVRRGYGEYVSLAASWVTEHTDDIHFKLAIFGYTCV